MDDLISRQDLLSKFDEVSNWSVVQIIKSIPSAEPVGNTDTLPNASCPYFDGYMCRRVICQSFSRG